MALEIRSIDSYGITVADQVGGGAELLCRLAAGGVDLLAFQATPVSPHGARFTVCPIDGPTMTAAARKAGLHLDGPRPALWIKGKEEPGALSVIYQRLSQAGIPVRDSSGIAHVNGGYGVLLFLEPEDCERAAAALRR